MLVEPLFSHSNVAFNFIYNCVNYMFENVRFVGK